ncbi:MAG: ABC transporter permease [Myxococcales bacterium]|nr:ABC transporter permease [Myxococcales bacterium]MCB9547331.1 ABC transporter permease [Myxococcales bacterium]
MRPALYVAAKELRLFAADRTGALLTVLIPVLLAALTGMLFAPSKSKGMDVLVVHGPGARVAAVVDDLRKADGLHIEVVDEATARDRVGRGKSPIALVFPPEADRLLTPSAAFSGERLTIHMLRDPSRELEGSFTQGLLFQALMTRLARGFADPAELKELLAQQRAAVARAPAGLPWGLFLDAADGLVTGLAAAEDGQGGELQLPFAVDEELLGMGEGPKSYHSYAHTFAGMLCMFLLFMAQGQAKRLIEERQEGTLVRLRMTPAPPGQILAGVGLATAAIALLISVAVYAAGMLAFGIPVRGPVVGFVAVLLGQAVFVGGFALLLAGLGRTTRQIESLGTFAVLVMAFTGGAWLPSFLMPDWLKAVGLALPTRWATDGLAAMTWRGFDLGAGLLAAGVLVAFGVGLALVGRWRFRWA